MMFLRLFLVRFPANVCFWKMTGFHRDEKKDMNNHLTDSHMIR